MFRLKKIKILSLAYVLTLIYLILGIIVSIAQILIKLNPQIASAINPNILNITYWQIFLIYPVSYAVGGFITGIAIGFLYNLIAKKTGGVAFELIQDSKTKTVSKKLKQEKPQEKPPEKSKDKKPKK